jgi:hypothetical protein
MCLFRKEINSDDEFLENLKTKFENKINFKELN